MSIHPSLNLSDKDKKQRSVLKRTERLRMMMEKGEWKEGDEVFGLPKIKMLRIKIKKEKAAKELPEAAASEAALASLASESKEQPAATKGPTPKSQDKK